MAESSVPHQSVLAEYVTSTQFQTQFTMATAGTFRRSKDVVALIQMTHALMAGIDTKLKEDIEATNTVSDAAVLLVREYRVPLEATLTEMCTFANERELVFTPLPYVDLTITPFPQCDMLSDDVLADSYDDAGPQLFYPEPTPAPTAPSRSPRPSSQPAPPPQAPLDTRWGVPGLTAAELAEVEAYARSAGAGGGQYGMDEEPVFGDTQFPEWNVPYIWILSPDERINAFIELDAFVRDILLKQWNMANKILPCWYKHPRVVNLLTGLYFAHLPLVSGTTDVNAVAGFQATLQGIIGIIDLTLPLSCSASSHEDDNYTSWVIDRDPDVKSGYTIYERDLRRYLEDNVAQTPLDR